MSFKKKFGAIVAGLALAGGTAVAVAPAAQAQNPQTYRIQHTLDAPRGLGGTIGYRFSGSSEKRFMQEGSSANGQTWSATGTPRYIYAGGGYCVWEELFRATSTDPSNLSSYAKVLDRNWGKGYASGTVFQLEGWTKGNEYAGTGLFSKLRVYAC